ncbi:MAG: hypothetical protein NTW06_01880 [Candidatus Falkowbacteria bacterium]|nr:hypothetical protein [Candidatus Falkowbacteria bacterium]
MKKTKTANKIPSDVSGWTDKYFHQSVFDTPLKYPEVKIINFLCKFKKDKKIKLYRGMNKYNRSNYTGVESWTYDKRIAFRYIKELSGKIVEKSFSSGKVLLDTTLLNKEVKELLGYDYKIDDKEVLILSK